MCGGRGHPGVRPLVSMSLAMLCERRRVIGMDYDAEKVVRRSNRASAAAGHRVHPRHLRTAERSGADAFLLVDRAAPHAPPRRTTRHLMRHGPTQADGSSSATAIKASAQRHASDRGVSTKIVGFNKTDGGLHFTSTPQLARSPANWAAGIHAAHKRHAHV